jgi:sulfur-oxidizing protein SoxZ
VVTRIQLPQNARRGEVIEVRLIVQHAMETGYRFDEGGRPIPRNVIRTLVCRYAGEEVFRAEMSQGIAANPYLQFTTVATESGDIEVSWTDEQGATGSERARLDVTG